jgi:hypothetical protein
MELAVKNENAAETLKKTWKLKLCSFIFLGKYSY